VTSSQGTRHGRRNPCVSRVSSTTNSPRHAADNALNSGTLDGGSMLWTRAITTDSPGLWPREDLQMQEARQENCADDEPEKASELAHGVGAREDVKHDRDESGVNE
jgi:hypothetical protein